MRRIFHIVKGMTPIHAAPSWVSMSSSMGMSGRSSAGSIGQCMNRRLPQF